MTTPHQIVIVIVPDYSPVSGQDNSVGFPLPVHRWNELLPVQKEFHRLQTEASVQHGFIRDCRTCQSDKRQKDDIEGIRTPAN
jgi:hypothetical protein